MRCGKLIAEATPSQLLARFQCQNLEDVFLTLSRHQQENVNGMDRSGIYCPEPPEALDAVPSARQTNSPMKFHNVRSSSSRRFKALIIKNVTQFLRHPGGILFAIVLPLIQSIIFYNAYGGEPRDLTVGIVNLEAGNCHLYENRGAVHYYEGNFTCEFIDLSCRYLRQIDDYSIKKVYYDYLSDAENDVRKGKILGIIHFGKNFSRALQRRLEDMRFVEEENIIMGEIQIWLDMSDRQLSLYLQKELYQAYFDSFKNVTAECQIPQKFVEIPIRFEDPIYGSNKEEYRAYATPPFVLTAIFFLAASVTSAIIITDKHEGVWDRSLVQGVKTPEILFAHFLVQLVVIIIQIIIIYCIFFVYFRLACNGSIFASLLISFLIGMCGMFYGFLVSMISSSHTMANYTVTGTFYPVILLCGFLWPLEGMPQFLRWISYFLPTTLPGISLRAIMIKGHPVANPEVYKGFLVVVGWTACLILLCLYRLKAKPS